MYWKIHELQKSGEPILLCGVNLDLLNWFDSSEIIKGIWEKAGLTKEDFLISLASVIPEEKIRKSINNIKKIWGNFPELGPYFLIDELFEAQESMEFYPDYRDHVAHQLKVFYLGLYFYENISTIKEAINQEIKLSNVPDAEIVDDFIRRWVAASLFHDIGYLLENQKNELVKDNSQGWQKIQESINKVFKCFLAHVTMFKDDFKITEQIEKSTFKSVEKVNRELDSPNDIGLISINNQQHDSLQDIDDGALLTGLGYHLESNTSLNNGPILRRYYNLAQSETPKGRPKFRDHGIISAMLLMHTWKYYLEHLTNIQNSTHPKIKSAIVEINKIVENQNRHWNNIIASASAIALHNIDLSLWDDTFLIERSLNTFDDFKLKLSANPSKTTTPLAFLLRLSDTIQNWDRPKYGLHRFKKTQYLAGDNFSIVTHNGKILLFFGKGPEYRDSYQYVQKLKEELINFLDEKDVNILIDNNIELEKLKGSFINVDRDMATPSLDPPDFDEKMGSSSSSEEPEIDEKIKEKIQVLLKNTSMDLTKCLSENCDIDHNCTLLWRSLYLTTELTRVLITLYEWNLIINILSTMEVTIHDHLLPVFQLNDIELKYKELRRFGRNIREFYKLISGFKREYPDKDTYSKNERIKKFIQLRCINIQDYETDDLIKLFSLIYNFKSDSYFGEKQLNKLNAYQEEDFNTIYNLITRIKIDLDGSLKKLTFDIHEIINFYFSTMDKKHEAFSTSANKSPQNCEKYLKIWEEGSNDGKPIAQ